MSSLTKDECDALRATWIEKLQGGGTMTEALIGFVLSFAVVLSVLMFVA